MQDTFVPSECLEILSKENRWDKRSFKEKIPRSIKITFLPRDLSLGFGCCSLFASINNEPLFLGAEPVNLEQLVKNTTDFGASLAPEEMPIIGSSSISERMRN
nr:hypothetical protein [Tanacetum cinerariifolium]